MKPLAATSIPIVAPTTNLTEILRIIRTRLDMDVGFISKFENGSRMFRYVDSSAGEQCVVQVGGSDPLEESYCHWVAEGRLPRLIQDSKDYPLSSELAVTETLGIGAYLSVPITLRSGQIYGTFCCFSSRTDRTLNERDLAALEAFAEVATVQIQQQVDDSEILDAKRSRIERLLRYRNVTIMLQPVIRLNPLRIEFVEALARFYEPPYQSPDHWFAAADEVGLGTDLQILTISKALENGIAQLPPKAALSINASAEVIHSAAFSDALAMAPLNRIILELTEHEAVKHYAILNQTLGPLRERGLRVAVDDMGAGFSSLKHVLELKPDIIKLDASLSGGIEKDPVKRSLAAALLKFSHETGSELVAEGVETACELQTLRDLGFNLFQGFLFGQPSPTISGEEVLSTCRGELIVGA